MNRTRRDMRYAIGKGLKDRRCTWFIRLIPHLVSSGWGMEGREMNHVNDRFLPRNSPSVRFRSSRVPLVTSPPTSLPHHSPTFHLPYGAGTAGERMVSGGEGGGMARTPRIHPAYRSYFLGSVVLSSHSPPVTPFRAHFVHSPLRAVGEWNETEWVSERNRDDSEAEGNGVRRWHDTRRPGTRRNRFRSPCVISSRSLHFVSPLSGLRSVLRPSLIPSIRLTKWPKGTEWEGTWRDRTERVTNGGGERCERRAAPFLLTFVTIAAFRSLSSPGSGLNLPPCFRRLSVTARVSFLSSLNTPVHIIDLEAVGMEWGDPTSGVETAGKGYDVMRECRGTWEQEIDSFWLVFPWLGS